jgi:hypothetical protein
MGSKSSTRLLTIGCQLGVGERSLCSGCTERSLFITRHDIFACSCSGTAFWQQHTIVFISQLSCRGVFWRQVCLLRHTGYMSHLGSPGVSQACLLFGLAFRVFCALGYIRSHRGHVATSGLAAGVVQPTRAEPPAAFFLPADPLSSTLGGPTVALPFNAV